MSEINILNVFNVMVSEQRGGLPYIGLAEYGYILDFLPTTKQVKILKANSRKLKLRTIFSREERENSDPFVLIQKQLLHYWETYGLNSPGLFNLEFEDGETLSVRFVHGISGAEVQDLVNTLIYANAPIKDIEPVKEILVDYSNYEFDRIQNNELRIALFDAQKDTFSSGDDAVRWIVQTHGNSNLLIKSDEVITAISSNKSKVPAEFLNRHEVQLSEVFNRHKRIIVAAKSKNNRNAINRIARLSKKNHKPLHMSFSKTFLTDALNGRHVDFGLLRQVSIRDKFKFLNLLAWKRVGLDIDAFVIRNGRMHVEPNRKIYDKPIIDRIESKILSSIATDLSHLDTKKILLDENVDYGLPISRKQTMGNLPFGTTVSVDSEFISSGIHWKDEWGAYDLDLSTVDRNGDRVGWGQYSGYSKNPIVFSGDVVGAGDGGMEFMTSNSVEYGLFVNVFSGKIGSEMDIVIGRNGKDRWIDDVIVQERVTLQSKGSICGFVNGKTFTVFSGRLGNSRVSGPNPIVRRGMAKFWTIQELLSTLNISFDTKHNKDIDYDIDLRYDSFTFDKLEQVISTKVVP